MYYFPPYKSYLQLLTRNFMEIDGIVCLLDTKTIEWIYFIPLLSICKHFAIKQLFYVYG